MNLNTLHPRLQKNWWIAIYGCCFLWVLPISLVMIGAPGQFVNFAVMLGWFVAWLVLPIALYDDMKFVRNHSEWNPRKWVYLVPAVIPVVAVVPGIIYLTKRHFVLGVP